MKKTLITALTLAAIAASPALAQSDQVNKTRGHTAHARAKAADTYGLSANDPAVVNDPYAVILENRVVGRDPDPFIRLQLMRDPALHY